MQISLLFSFILLFLSLTESADQLESSSSEEEMIYGSHIFIADEVGRPLANQINNDQETDIENGTVVPESQKSCHLHLIKFLQNDLQFRRAFPTASHRKNIIRRIFNSIKDKDEDYYTSITAGKIVANFDLEDSELELAAFLLNYIDRQATDNLPDYSLRQSAINKFTRSVIKYRCSNHLYWRQLAKLLRIARGDLLGHVNNLPLITDSEKDTYKAYNQKCKYLNLITAMPLALIPSNYWYMNRSFDSTPIELFLIYIIFTYLLSIYAYEHFLFENIKHQIKTLVIYD